MTWTIPPLTCTLNSYTITIEQADDEFARALVEHVYPDRDGADLEDCGADSQRVTLTGHVSGPLWLSTLDGLKASLSLLSIHTLVHPQFGTLTGRVRRLSVTHRDDEHDLARLRIEFVAGTVQEWSFEVSASILSAAAAVENAAAAVTAAAAGL